MKPFTLETRPPEANGPHPSGTLPKLGVSDWILVLDDDRLASRAVGRWVKQIVGVEVRTAQTILEAECWLKCSPTPLAILTDFELGDRENGAQALERLRYLGCAAPAAVVTGAPDLALMALAESSLREAIPVISKSELPIRLRDWLEHLQLCWAVSEKVSA
jgi:hypothetical protein